MYFKKTYRIILQLKEEIKEFGVKICIRKQNLWTLDIDREIVEKKEK